MDRDTLRFIKKGRYDENCECQVSGIYYFHKSHQHLILPDYYTFKEANFWMIVNPICGSSRPINIYYYIYYFIYYSHMQIQIYNSRN